MPRVSSKQKGKTSGGTNKGSKSSAVIPADNSVGNRSLTPRTRGRGIRRSREETEQNPPNDTPPPKRTTRGRPSGTNEGSQPLPLTEADIPRIVNAVLQGLPSPPNTSTLQSGEDEDLEHLNGEQVAT